MEGPILGERKLPSTEVVDHIITLYLPRAVSFSSTFPPNYFSTDALLELHNSSTGELHYKNEIERTSRKI